MGLDGGGVSGVCVEAMGNDPVVGEAVLGEVDLRRGIRGTERECLTDSRVASLVRS